MEAGWTKKNTNGPGNADVNRNIINNRIH